MGKELPYHLRTDSPPMAICDQCGRKSWDRESIARPCVMPQPDGTRCVGAMTRALQYLKRQETAA